MRSARFGGNDEVVEEEEEKAAEGKQLVEKSIEHRFETELLSVPCCDQDCSPSFIHHTLL